ncbi:apolipoprotein N-acyltransferase [Salinibacterium sp. SYSU T00001]|uniref:apolipoprotein N-acyltransferase n=1 Tax=Homoserinimonas sedimenticola TaxID=2986805 RepID=UPI00223648FE|nr:apolipoprotein N-acyltransferase [Salinibacterium sedimenticola]MCW4384480.1 apolipoprotein N-acyltransferase [Salinibacterium sedimenticola]
MVSTIDRPSPAPTNAAAPRPRRWSWTRLAAAVVGGLVLSAAFPPIGWWPLAILGTALLLWSLRGAGTAAAVLLGLGGGFAFYGTHIFWLTTYLGPVPWLALAGVETLFFAVAAVIISYAWRWGLAATAHPLWRFSGLPVVLAGLWTAREGIVSVWPYGGFSWGRLAFSQSEGAFREAVAWLGAAGLGFVLALIAALLVQGACDRQARGSFAVRAAPLAVITLVALLVPTWPAEDTGDVTVAAVQGNSEAGLWAQRQRGDILDEHLQATVPVLDAEVDVVVWPENAADLNPLRYPQAAGVLDYVTEEMDAPLIAGTITDGDEGQTFNSILLWEAGEGAVAQYDKIHPVPFAEYLPDREFWYPLAPALFDLIPRDYSFGQRPNVLDIALPDGGTLAAGIAICFDIVDDELLHQMIDGGAEVIFAPTNNADFGQSAESVQQLAIARLRAIEYGRSLVNISTVGASAIIAPDGSTIADLPTFEPGAMVETIPLRDSVTPAAAIGRQVEWFTAGIGMLGLLAVGGLAVRRSRGGTREAAHG